VLPSTWIFTIYIIIYIYIYIYVWAPGPMGLAPFGTFQLCLFHYIIYIYIYICLGHWAPGTMGLAPFGTFQLSLFHYILLKESIKQHLAFGSALRDVVCGPVCCLTHPPASAYTHS